MSCEGCQLYAVRELRGSIGVLDPLWKLRLYRFGGGPFQDFLLYLC